MTTQLSEIFVSDSQLFKTSVYDVDGVTAVTPSACVCTVWNKDTGTAVITNATGTVGDGYAQYNWSGSSTAGNYEAILTVTISAGVVKSENFFISVLAKPTAAHILTPAQAANALRVSASDSRMLDLIPLVDMYIQKATGRDWTQDAAINKTAIAAATMLLVQWYDNPSMIGVEGSLAHGLSATLSQLEAEALKYRKYQFEGLNGGGWVYLPGAREGDTVIKLVGVYGSSGSQVANFESSISEEDRIEQTSTDNLDEHLYVIILKSPADDIIP